MYSHQDRIRAVELYIKLGERVRATIANMESVLLQRSGRWGTQLLKLYIYGYLNQVQSSRRLERESQRNVELMWLP